MFGRHPAGLCAMSDDLSALDGMPSGGIRVPNISLMLTRLADANTLVHCLHRCPTIKASSPSRQAASLEAVGRQVQERRSSSD